MCPCASFYIFILFYATTHRNDKRFFFWLTHKTGCSIVKFECHAICACCKTIETQAHQHNSTAINFHIVARSAEGTQSVRCPKSKYPGPQANVEKSLGIMRCRFRFLSSDKTVHSLHSFFLPSFCLSFYHRVLFITSIDQID